MKVGDNTLFYPTKDDKPQAAIVVDTADDGTVTMVTWDAQGRQQTRHGVKVELMPDAKPHVIQPQA